MTHMRVCCIYTISSSPLHMSYVLRKTLTKKNQTINLKHTHLALYFTFRNSSIEKIIIIMDHSFVVCLLPSWSQRRARWWRASRAAEASPGTWFRLRWRWPWFPRTCPHSRRSWKEVISQPRAWRTGAPAPCPTNETTFEQPEKGRDIRHTILLKRKTWKHYIPLPYTFDGWGDEGSRASAGTQQQWEASTWQQYVVLLLL